MEVSLHPWFSFSGAVVQIGVSCSVDRLSGNVELGITGAEVEVRTITGYDVSKGMQ